MPAASFTFRDGERLVRFCEGALDEAAGLLEQNGFAGHALLTTPRAREAVPALADAAEVELHVGPGKVDELSARLLPEAGDRPLLALGGGRVIDTAKAIAAVTGASGAAIPTTLSGAEMTAIHRLPAGSEGRPLVRPELVIADPEAMTSQPEAQLRVSAMNALAHGADSLYTPFANPVSELTALRGAALIAAALDQRPQDRDRAVLALGSLLCGYAIASALFALHHVVCQSLVRVLGIPHAETNAAILPWSMAAMRDRAPRELGALAEAIGTEPTGVDARILELGGQPSGLGELGADAAKIDAALDAILARPELGHTPDPPGRDELRRLIEAAW
jgi:alcohol dehydrogenase class IV